MSNHSGLQILLVSPSMSTHARTWPHGVWDTRPQWRAGTAQDGQCVREEPACEKGIGTRNIGIPGEEGGLIRKNSRWLSW